MLSASMPTWSFGGWLSFGFATADLHFLRFLAGSENQVCAVKQAIHDVGLFADSVITFRRKNEGATSLV
jgi:hypothetical protein